MRNKAINIFKLLLPIIFIGYIGAKTLFVHIHNIEGVLVAHSHPFKALHDHSTAEFETITFISNFEKDSSPLLFALPTLLAAFLGFILYKRAEFVLRATYHVINTRGPPSLF